MASFHLLVVPISANTTISPVSHCALLQSVFCYEDLVDCCSFNSCLSILHRLVDKLLVLKLSLVCYDLCQAFILNIKSLLCNGRVVDIAHFLLMIVVKTHCSLNL